MAVDTGKPTKSRSVPNVPVAAAGKYHVRAVPVKQKGPASRLSTRKLIHLAHRFAVFLCAVLYVSECFLGAYTAVGLLSGNNPPLFHDEDSTFNLMREFAGNATIRESKLIHNTILQGATTPVNGTLYLKDSSSVSLEPCADLVGIQTAIYETAFLASIFRSIVRDTTYHVTQLHAMELIAPTIDCSTSDIRNGDASTARFFYLARSPNDTVTLLIVSLSNQPYTFISQGERGPAGVATLQLIQNMQTTNLETYFLVSVGYPFEDISFRGYEYVNTTADGQWLLQSNPRNDDELTLMLQTANRDGFFIKAESEQSNLLHDIWLPETTAYAAVQNWRWLKKPVVHDSWGWVHVVLLFIGLTVLANLVVLCIATTQNFLAGKWWIGDAFVSITTAQVVNGVLVMVAWAMNDYWVLHEFCFSIGFELSGVTPIRIYESVMRAHLFTLYMSASGLIGHVLHERIDPLLVTTCFHVGFHLRLQIHRLLPAFEQSIADYAAFAYAQSLSLPPPGNPQDSIMGYWAPHTIGKRHYGFVLQCLFPIYITLVLVVIYALAHKTYHYFCPTSAKIQQATTGSSYSINAAVANRVMTLFEVATGAQLEDRFGLVSDYETCIFIKGMKFASADGIYSTGFVIANKKYLLQTSDYWSIVLMKLLRRRFRNIYVYDVSGSTVQQTARLVYPHTLTVQDLCHVNVSVLS